MIDFCTGFNGGNSDVLSRMFYGLLRRNCDLSNYQVHVVDNGVPIEMMGVGGFPPSAIKYKIKEGWHPTRGRYYTDSMVPQYEMHRWMVDNCGTCEWCVMCDFDMIIRRDVLAYMKERMSPDVGVIGSHGTDHNQLTPLFAVNRRAWRNRRIGFQAGPGKDGKQRDLGLLLAEDLEAQGFKWVKFELEPGMEPYYHHMGGGGGYHNKREFDAMRETALRICEEQGL